MKRLILTALFAILFFPLFSQISEGGIPPSFSSINTKALSLAPKKMSIKMSQDISRLKWEDAITEKNGAPPRVAIVLPVDINLTEDGEWITLADGTKICRLTLNSTGALGILLYYSEFYIPEGDKLFIYNKAKDQLLGAYTNKTNPKDRHSEFSTQMVGGDELTFEYVSSSKTDQPSIVISGFGYGYNHINSNTKATGYGASGSCQVNVNCSEGNNWQVHKRGIARIISKIGFSSYYCSGSLINNTRNDATPYFLSAYHCFFSNSSEADYSSMQFYFDYEMEGCAADEEIVVNSRTKVLVGSQMLVANPISGGSDGALLKLNNTIPDDMVVCYNGWNATNTPATSGVCIHHPSGDVKKISTYTTPITTGTAVTEQGTSKSNVHWIVRFAATANGHGTTEGGSSGSSLFNENGLIVGSLTAGGSSCSSLYGSDYYSKLWYNLDQDANVNMHMSKYLDPDNSGVRVLNRYYPFDEELVISSDTVRLKEKTSYSLSIVSGNGGYTAQVGNSTIALVDVVDDKNLLIKALNKGITDIQVKDITGQEEVVTVSVYPDEIMILRTNNSIVVKLLETETDNSIKEILVMDLMGRIVSKTITAADVHSYELDAYKWSRGAYIVKVKTSKGNSIIHKVLW